MPCIRRKTDALAALLLAFAAAAAGAQQQEVQSHDSIREAARQHVQADAGQLAGSPQVTVGRLDSRLRLAACDRPLVAYDSPNGLNRGRGVVGVRCEGSRPWKIYVPVSVALMERVVVNRRPLVRGQTLRADDLALREVDTAGLHKAYFTRLEDVVGLRSKRAVARDTTLHAGLLQRAELVKRGAQVDILAVAEGLRVRMRGKALADGGRGDRIRVKNLRSGRVVSGTVTGPGLVEVMP